MPSTCARADSNERELCVTCNRARDPARSLSRSLPPRSTYTTGSGKDREEHPFTLCWTRVAAPDRPTAVSLGPRELGGLFDGILGAFSSWHEVELESVEFEHRFSLWAADRSDELAVRRFFTPLMIARCI